MPAARISASPRSARAWSVARAPTSSTSEAMSVSKMTLTGGPAAAAPPIRKNSPASNPGRLGRFMATAGIIGGPRGQVNASIQPGADPRSLLSSASRRMATFIRTGPGRTHGGRQTDADRRPGGRGGPPQGQGRAHPRPLQGRGGRVGPPVPGRGGTGGRESRGRRRRDRGRVQGRNQGPRHHPGREGEGRRERGRPPPRGEGGRPAQRRSHRRWSEGQGRPREPPGHPLILRELADRLGCALRGDGAVEVDRVAPIDAAGPGSLTFVASAKWAVRLRTTQASAVIVHPSIATPLPSLLSDNPYLAFAGAVVLLHPKAAAPPGVHPSVVIEDDVEVGALTAIDRAALGETRIGRGTKLDNLVQIGHSVTVGRDTVLAGQVGVAGSSTIGDRVTLAGQVGVAGHLKIGDGVIATAQTGIPHYVDAGTVISGYPAIPNREWLKASAVFPRLPELLRRLRALEKRLGGDPPDEG